MLLVRSIVLLPRLLVSFVSVVSACGCLLELLTGLDVIPSIDHVVSVLPVANVSFVPWSTGPWPAYLDGINHRWQSLDSELSPAEKYATAFGLDVRDFTNQMSKISGVDSSNRTCAHSNDCEDNQVCGKRRGMTTGRCHSRSTSLQDAWALAAVEVAEPKCAVEKNGVTFHPQDIKALVTQLYFQSDRRSDKKSREFARFSTAVVPDTSGMQYLNVCLEHYSRCSASEPAADFFIMLSHVVGRLQQPLLVRFAEADGSLPIVGYRVQEFKRLPNSTTDWYQYTSVRVELDVIAHSLDEDESLSVMRAQLSFTACRTYGHPSASIVLVTSNGLLRPVSLEYPLPRRLNEDTNSKLSVRNVMDLVSASLNCAKPSPIEPQVCNSVPYTLELRRLRRQVERCEAASQFSFSAVNDVDLGRACFQQDCREVFDALRRINYRGCRLPSGVRLPQLLDSFYSLCVSVEAPPPLDWNMTRPTPVPTIEGASDPPQTRVPPATSPAKTKRPSTRRPLDGSSDDGMITEEDDEMKHRVPDPRTDGFSTQRTSESAPPANRGSLQPTGTGARPNEPSERPSATTSPDETVHQSHNSFSSLNQIQRETSSDTSHIEKRSRNHHQQQQHHRWSQHS